MVLICRKPTSQFKAKPMTKMGHAPTFEAGCTHGVKPTMKETDYDYMLLTSLSDGPML